MKFVIVLGLLAMTIAANASVIPVPGSVAIHATPQIISWPWGYPYAWPNLISVPSVIDISKIPGAVTVNAPATVKVSTPVALLPPPEATYVAKTPSAVHEAKLPGHTQSQEILNIDPAPGTVTEESTQTEQTEE